MTPHRLRHGGPIAALVLAALAVSCRPAADDPLGAELRARVDELQRDVEATPTTASNVAERAEVLWEWTNAFARAGGVLPVNLTQVPAAVERARVTGQSLGDDELAQLDAFVHELTVKDADPRAIGEVTVSPSGPLAAGSFATLEQTYTVGTMPMAVGGVVLVGRQLGADQSRLQHRDPSAEGYLTIRSSRAGASWEPTEVPLAGMHGGFRGAEPMPSFRLAGAALERGDTFTVVYGDTSGGSPGMRLQSFSTDQLLLPFYVDLEGKGTFFTPRWAPISIAGGAVTGVSAIAPSVVAPDQPFALSVRSEDRVGNRATGAKPAYRVLLDGAEVATVPAGGDSAGAALVSVPDLRLATAGTYRYRVRSEDGSIEAWSNPIWVREAGAPRIFWGETHGHTGMAEGQGSAGSYWVWARDDARLDFAALSEHDIWLDDFEWSEMQRLARETTRAPASPPGSGAPGFVALLGYEWTAPRNLGGHHNVFFRAPDRARVGVQTAPTLPDLYRGLHASGAPESALVIPHAHQAGDWTQNDAALEKLVEIYSMHGTFEWFGNLYLRNGFEVGFVAASDDHRSRPGGALGARQAPLMQRGGLAAAVAPELTTDAIFDALRGLSSYATSGQRILLDATLNGHPMGTRQPDDPAREIVARVAGTSPIDHLDVIKNGEVVWSRHFLAAPLAARSWIQVGFESSTDVHGERDNPRPYRVWKGTIEVEGARLLSVRPSGLDNVFNDRAEIDPDDPGRVSFQVETRGRRDVLLVELEGASPATALRVHLEPTVEYGFAPVLVRRPAEIPGADLRLPLSELVDGRLERELPVDVHTDLVRLQVVDLERPLDQQVTYTDMGPPQPGDYYYVRVTQLDGGRAWSSPFWVGKKP
jgi:hypothetical protein